MCGRVTASFEFRETKSRLSSRASFRSLLGIYIAPSQEPIRVQSEDVDVNEGKAMSGGVEDRIDR